MKKRKENVKRKRQREKTILKMAMATALYIQHQIIAHTQAQEIASSHAFSAKTSSKFLCMPLQSDLYECIGKLIAHECPDNARHGNESERDVEPFSSWCCVNASNITLHSNSGNAIDFCKIFITIYIVRAMLT